ncbi:MAG: hypothetical protein ABIO49_09465 [Dokdonella sp.]
MAVAIAIALVCLIALASAVRQRVRRKRKHRRPPMTNVASAFRRSLQQRKPEWVRGEIIRLRAWSPGLGCRKIADAFSRQFAIPRRMSGRKSYVAAVLKISRAEVTYSICDARSNIVFRARCRAIAYGRWTFPRQLTSAPSSG